MALPGRLRGGSPELEANAAAAVLGTSKFAPDDEAPFCVLTVAFTERDDWLSPPSSSRGVAAPRICDGPGFRIGEVVSVDRYRMSFPCTTKLSFDFLRSRVSISTSRRPVVLSDCMTC